MTMTLIQTVNVGSGGVASIDFSTIPSTYNDLLLIVSARSDSGTTTRVLSATLNSSYSSYTDRLLSSTGSSATTTANIASYGSIYGGAIPAATSTSNIFSNTSFYFPNYLENSHKLIFVEVAQENNSTSSQTAYISSKWSNTSAITSILLTTSGNFVQNTVASLYGILKGSGGATVS